MGYASLREDVVNRLLGELDSFSSRLKSHSRQLPREFHFQLEALRNACRGLQRDLDASTELATSPEVNLANRLREAERENARLLERLEDLEDIESRYKRIVSDRVAKYVRDTGSLKNEIKRLNAEIRRAKDESGSLIARAEKFNARLHEQEKEAKLLRKNLKKAERRR